MVIDIHCHLWTQDNVSPLFYEPQARSIIELMDIEGEDSRKDAVAGVLDGWWDPDGEVTLKRMEDAGIRLTVLFPLDYARVTGEPNMNIIELNRELSDLQQKHPGKLIYFFNVDPRREDAVGLCETAVKDWGAKGLKFHSVVGYYPTDKETYALLEIAQESKIPVLFHSGPFVKPFKGECSHPSYIEKAASDFPGVDFITAHLSFDWWRELIELGKKRENLMADFSAWQMVVKSNYGQFRRILRRVMDAFGKDRILFGTDGPAVDTIMSRKEWVEKIRELAEPHEEGSVFKQEEIDAILEGNAVRVLGL